VTVGEVCVMGIDKEVELECYYPCTTNAFSDCLQEINNS
jgi:hypothetical protein